MNIVIFTPTAKSSAIGRMAAMVSRELIVQGHFVAIVRTECEALLTVDSHSFGCVPVNWNDYDLVGTLLSSADLVVHQVGNSFEFHEGNIRWIDEASAVVCLHDFYLGHLFFGWAQERTDEAKSILRDLYGEGADKRFFEAASVSTFVELTCEAFPMTEWIASRAAAVIAHSSWAAPRLLSACPGPVVTVPLAYDILPSKRDGAHGTIRSADGIVLLTVGHVNQNKRVEQVLRAIASSRTLTERVTYRLAGLVEPKVVIHLTALARTLGVRLVISGEVDPSVLADAFTDADIISCLRWPSLESASASAVEAMLYGKPTLVTDTAFYREIPDDCAVKIHQATEHDDIVAALEKLCADADLRQEIGARARSWAVHMFTAENYARQLAAMTIPVRRSAWLRRGAEVFESYLAAWGGSSTMLTARAVRDPISIISG